MQRIGDEESRTVESEDGGIGTLRSDQVVNEPTSYLVERGSIHATPLWQRDSWPGKAGLVAFEARSLWRQPRRRGRPPWPSVLVADQGVSGSARVSAYTILTACMQTMNVRCDIEVITHLWERRVRSFPIATTR